MLNYEPCLPLNSKIVSRTAILRMSFLFQFKLKTSNENVIRHTILSTLTPINPKFINILIPNVYQEFPNLLQTEVFSLTF